MYPVLFGYKNILRLVIAFCWLLLCSTAARAGDEHYLNVLTGKIKAGQTCQVKDDKYGNSTQWQKIERDISVNNIITFELRHDTSLYYYDKPFTCELNYDITYEDRNGGSRTYAGLKLNLKYDTAKAVPYQGTAMFKFSGGHKVTIKINSISSPQLGGEDDLPAVFRIRNEIQINRSYLFSTANTDVAQHAFTTAPTLGKQLNISWSTGADSYAGAEMYDLEYTFYDDYSDVADRIKALNSPANINAGNITVSQAELESWLLRNSTRITTSTPSHMLNMVYGSGFLLYRVRGVRINPLDNERQETAWSYQAIGGSGTASTVVRLDASHEPSLNWQYTASFSEEGKHKEVITYYDGTLRNRQQATLDNSSNRTVVQAPVYDVMGREAATFLPAPELDSSLHFFRNLNMASDGSKPYSFQQLGIDTLACIPTPEPAGNTSGVSRYYSPNNQHTNAIHARYIPDAQGYPFSVKQYTADNTGRIRLQGNVGLDLQPGKGHEIRYFYGKPSQLELDRLFGSETGDASHYQKTMEVDANGQVSVRYINADGKTIATALAGKAPDNLYALPSQAEAQAPFTADLANRYNTTRSTADFTITSNSSLLIPLPGTYHFKYSYDPATVITSPCENNMQDLCSDGYYDLWITVKDECGAVKHEEKIAANLSGIETSCDRRPGPVSGTFDADLPIGEYQTSFQLRVSKAAAEYYDSAYLKQLTCILTEDDFKRNYIANMDLLGCFGEVTPCAATLGSKTLFTARLLNLMQENGLRPLPADTVMASRMYDSLLLKCQQNTVGMPAPCADAYLQIVADVTPGGQYATYDDNALQQNSATIFTERDVNVLTKYKDITGFVDDNDKLDSVYNDNGELKAPKDLTEAEFIRNWKPSWAKALIVFHPEYGYYRWCELTAASRRFDASLEDIHTGQDARNAGYWDGSNPLLLLQKDAFFAAGGAGASSYSTMQNKLQQFSRYIRNDASLPVSNVLQVINYIVYCAKDTTVKGFNNCAGPANCAAGRDEDQEWELYRTFYLQLKAPQMEIARGNSPIDTVRNSRNCYIGGGLVKNDPNLGNSYGQENIINGRVKTCPDDPLTAKYANKHRLFAEDIQTEDFMQSLSAQSLARMSDSIKQINDAALYENCHKNCLAQADSWMQALKGCQQLVIGNDSTKYKQLQAGLIAVCEKGCDMSHIFGASTISPDSTNVDRTFEDVMNRVLGPGAINSSCTALLINYPATYETATQEYVSRDSCTCEKITAFYDQYKQTAYGVSTAGFLRWLQQKFGSSFVMTTEQLDILLRKCVAGDCVTPSQMAFPLPYALTCKSCASCDVVQAKVMDFQRLYPTLTPADNNYETLLTNYLNKKLNFNLSYVEYYEFIGRCNGKLGDVPVTNISCEAFTKAYQQFSLLQPDYYANPNGNTHMADSFKVYLRDWMNIVFSKQLRYEDYASMAANCNLALNIPHDSVPPVCAGSPSTVTCVPGVMDCCALDTYLGNFKYVFPIRANARLLAYYFRMQASQWCAPKGIPVIDPLSSYASITNFYNHLSVPHETVIDVVDDVANYTSNNNTSCNLPGINFGDGGSGLVYADYMLCNRPLSPVLQPDTVPCMRTRMDMALINASLSYSTYRDSVLKDFQDIYLTKCLSVQPQMTVSGTLVEYHYTLYYYDQAGNLVKTIPPKGVKLLTEDELDAVRRDRPYNIAECYQTVDTLSFKGNGAYIPYPTWMTGAYKPYSIETWVNREAGHDQGIFSDNIAVSAPSRFIDSTYTIPAFNGEKGVSCFTRGNQLVFRSGRHIPFWWPYPIFEQVEGVAAVPLSTLLPAGTWSHIVITGTGNPLKPFSVVINGRAIPVQYDTTHAYLGGALTEQGTKQFRFGAAFVKGNWQYWQGYIKQLRIYDRFVNYAEAWMNYNNICLNPRNDAGLRTWLPMNEGMGSLLHDRVTEQDIVLEGAPGYSWIRNHNPVLVKHDQPTTYAYNTLNGIIRQSTPDGGVFKAWYDRLGRSVVSQNAEQRQPLNGGESNRYSYSIYDPLGRTIETGEKGGSPITDINTLDTLALSSWMQQGSRSQIVKTFYDFPLPGLGLLQENTRKRVTASTVDEDGDGQYDNASFYSYDLLGNVKTLWQYQQRLELAKTGQGMKRMDYDFDLVSGKVNNLFYQKGQPDQFVYRYLYDAENRIVAALSSRDNMTWQQDATYWYYLHGPLARVELGEHKVQGIDYAYTLQGWLKGINAAALDGNDMGGDGITGNHSLIAKDVMGVTLGYNGNDYAPINPSNTTAFNMPYVSGIVLSTGNGLYNGNISYSTLALSNISGAKTTGYTYGYDQLNRLKEAKQHTLQLGQAWNSTSATEDYREKISYDANGNILAHSRNAVGAMDDLTYHYKKDNNQLTSVSDAIGNSQYKEDIKGQQSDNYTYDAIGNLIKDKSEGVEKIGWTVYGKIRNVIGRNPVSFSYGPDGNRIRKQSGDSSVFYIRDAAGRQLAIYKQNGTQFIWEEQQLYGSSRLGILKHESMLPPRLPYPTSLTDTLSDAYNTGLRNYEVVNHLGNVMAVLTDKKQGVSANTKTVDYYTAISLSQQDYYAFGMLQPGRKYALKAYRYGFNGKEIDNETKGEGNQLDYGMRIYDPRIGKFLSTDPIAHEYAGLTPYQFASNSPVSGIDLNGLEYYFAADGTYIGVGNQANRAVRVVDANVVKEYGSAEKIHQAVESNAAKARTAIMMTEGPSKTFYTTYLTVDVLLNNAHSIYGEAGTKSSEYRKLAHVINNREIKYAKYIAALRNTIIGVDKKTKENLYSTEKNTTVLKLNALYGFNRYVAFGVYKPMDPAAVDKFRETFEVNGYQIDGGKQNGNYANYFMCKGDIKELQLNIPSTKEIFKEIIDARSGVTKDPNPNADSWKGDGKTNNVSNDMPKYKSDEEPKSK
ncbi:RHS repeat-associated core domain-containing protein [Chitinophaga flava]|uniref:DUF6443 domain-containing protein n=1 Tax=Chitinophaga flava TaxID=2259036 RepID=A0A365XRY4_9BACT|nr:RHS repeat-associated core domain-containing protein [Chitinophaga flava]RBL89109.1 hypothetical protein DF182_21475 [Chitinophaga flava]